MATKNSIFRSIEELTLDCPEFFDASYDGTSESIIQSGERLFSEYQNSIGLTISTEAQAVHENISKIKRQYTAFDAVAKLIDDVSTLLLASKSTLAISKSLGISHEYVKKIKRFFDKKIAHECENFNIPQKLYSLTQTNDTTLQLLNQQFRKLSKNLQDEDQSQAVSITNLKKIRMLADTLNDTIASQRRVVIALDKVKPKDTEKRTSQEIAAENLRQILINVVEDVVSERDE